MGEAPGKTVEPVLCPEGGVFLPSATCHTFPVSCHLCAQRTIQTSACGLFSCGRNVLRTQTACQAAFFFLVLSLFVKHSHPSPLPSRQMLSGCICWGVLRFSIQVVGAGYQSSREAKSLILAPSSSIRAALFLLSRAINAFSQRKAGMLLHCVLRVCTWVYTTELCQEKLWFPSLLACCLEI